MTRDEILAEIRRTADEDGGKPLGRERFERVTGITGRQWGRYWPRFSEALIDAGFEPNTMNAAYDDEHLMVQLISLIRELGKFPTVSEMQVQHYRDPEFPTHNVFGRYGLKNDLVGAVLAYSSERPEYADVVAICEPLHGAGRSSRSDSDSTADTVDCRFVYCVRGRRGEYKIGRAALVERRMAELSTSSSVPLVLEHKIQTDDPVGVEAYWHGRFASQRMKNGEWFKLSASDVRAFRRWKRIH